MINIRKAEIEDIERIAEIYERIHDETETGRLTTGWKRGVYPTRETAEAALLRGDIFVLEEDGRVAGSAILNHFSDECYKEGNWKIEASDEQVMVMHTLTIDPECSRRGLGKSFVEFYEKYAIENGCISLRMDTQAINTIGRRMYAGLGFFEAGIVPCDFNGIPDVRLVLLEKKC